MESHWNCEVCGAQGIQPPQGNCTNCGAPRTEMSPIWNGETPTEESGKALRGAGEARAKEAETTAARAKAESEAEAERDKAAAEAHAEYDKAQAVYDEATAKHDKATGPADDEEAVA